MLAKIKKWIDDPNKNYLEGVEIFKQHKINDKYDAFFMQVTNPPVSDMHYKLLTKKVAQIYRKLVLNPPEKPDTRQEVDIQVKKINLTKPKNDLRTINELVDDFDKLEFSLLPYGELKLLANELSPELGKQPKSKEIIKSLNEIKKYNKLKPDKFYLIDRPKIRKPETEINLEDLPEVLQFKFKENQQLTTEMATMHAKAKASKEEKERAEFIECLLDLDDRRAANWIDIDAWWKTKDDKKDEPVQGVVDQVLGLTRRLNTLNVNISRTEKKLKEKPDHKKASKWKLSLNKYKSGKAEVERYLDSLKKS